MSINFDKPKMFTVLINKVGFEKIKQTSSFTLAQGNLA